MPVSFLDLLPKAPTAVVPIVTMQGTQDIEVSGVSLRALGQICERFPVVGKILDGGFGHVLDHPEATAAIVAAGLGHAGDEKYEAHVASFPAADVGKLGMQIIQLTFAERDADPLSVAANGAGDAPSLQTSPLQLNS